MLNFYIHVYGYLFRKVSNCTSSCIIAPKVLICSPIKVHVKIASYQCKYMYTSGIRCFQEWDELMLGVQYDLIGSGLFWCLEYDVLVPRVDILVSGMGFIGGKSAIWWCQVWDELVLEVELCIVPAWVIFNSW